MRCFSARIEESQEMSNIWLKTCKKSHIFEDFSILSEKQHMKPLDLDYHKNLASFDTLVDPEAAKVRNEMSWRACNPVCSFWCKISKFP